VEWRIAGRKNRVTNLAYMADRGYFGGPSSLRLAAQDVALSRRKQGFESPRERHPYFSVLISEAYFLGDASRDCR
jgi:hypothetical protein